MNKPELIATPKDQYPRVKIATWTGSGLGISLTVVQKPIVAIVSCDGAVEWEGSFDGVTWYTIRDTDSRAIRHVKPGVYEIPVAVGHLRPVVTGTATVSTFIPG